MTNTYYVETLRTTTAIQTLRLAKLIEDLSRSVKILTADIENEEAQANIRDVSHPAYPILARNLRGRRDNILVTIRALEAQLASQQIKAAA